MTNTNSSFDTMQYTIDPRPDGRTVYHFPDDNADFTFQGVSAQSDRGRPTAVVQLLPDGQTTGLLNGPIIRFVNDSHYVLLKQAILKRPGGQQTWDDLGVDNILSSGSSAPTPDHTANTDPIPADDDTIPIQVGDHVTVPTREGPVTAVVVPHGILHDVHQWFEKLIASGHHVEQEIVEKMRALASHL